MQDVIQYTSQKLYNLHILSEKTEAQRGWELTKTSRKKWIQNKNQIILFCYFKETTLKKIITILSINYYLQH